jgi:hypothetical protein
MLLTNCRAVRRQMLKLQYHRRGLAGELSGKGGGKFGDREHAQEEQYFRKKVIVSASSGKC